MTASGLSWSRGPGCPALGLGHDSAFDVVAHLEERRVPRGGTKVLPYAKYRADGAGVHKVSAQHTPMTEKKTDTAKSS